MRCPTILLTLLWTQPLFAQQACQPLQGTSAHASCLNQQLARSDPALRALEEQAGNPPITGFTAPDLLLSERTGAPPLALDPGFGASQAAGRLRLQQSTQARTRALSGQVNRSLAPRLGY